MQLTKRELAKLERQFDFDPEKYIEEHGLVRDKEKAIELLCESNKAWAVLDESLKMDPEVIMYYQPMGYRIDFGEEIVNHDGVLDEVLTKAYFCEEGFTADLFIIYLWNHHGDAFMPQINYPKNFDSLTYLKIQYELYLNSTFNQFGESSHFPRTYYKHDKFRKAKESAYRYYDLQMLKTLVPQMYSPKSDVKTIGTHPAMQSKTTSENQ